MALGPETNEERLLALLAKARPALSDAQFERLIEVLKQPHVLAAMERRPTHDQAALDKFFRETLQGIGLLPDVANRLRLDRDERPPLGRGGRWVHFPTLPPANTTKARVYLESTVVTLDVRPGDDGVELPPHILEVDRVIRVEFLEREGSPPLAVLDKPQPPPPPKALSPTG